MKLKRFTEEQIIGILKQAQAGMKIVDLCRMHGISDATFYNWRSKYGGMEVLMPSALKSLKQRITGSNRCLQMLCLKTALLRMFFQKSGNACHPAECGFLLNRNPQDQ